MSAVAINVFLFLLGLVFGSFFNVLIYRLPRDLSIIKPGSHCPHCKTAIKWYDNIPLLSYILLGGKCRACGGKISFRYPLIEFLTGVIFVGVPSLAKLVGLSGVKSAQVSSAHQAVSVIFVLLMMLIFVIDLEHQIIPDQLNLALFILALVAVFVLRPTISPSLMSSAIGMFALSIFFFALAVSIGGMGMGDVKMAIGLGLFFGWQLVLVVAFLAFLIGGVFAIFLALRLVVSKKYRPRIAIPFGPYLAIASAITLFYGEKILGWYLSFFRVA